jgi:DNA-binding response OmpR family regulator
LTASPSGTRVLLVDDDLAVLALVRTWLTAAGYTVTACHRFEDAKQQLTTQTPDVLVADVRLGAYNGIQLVLQARARSPRTQIVAITGFDDPLLRREARRAGAVYLLKPFTHDQMLEAVAGHPRDSAAT